jgi:glutamate formiminotransferase/formiminotetrahydrofolate cyclodeaminase
MLGAKVTGSEIVGVIPKESLVLAGKFYVKKDGIKISNDDEFVTLSIEKLGLSQLYQFKSEEKVIEYMIEETGHLVNLTIKEFLSELASNSPAPGGGSVAALSGALGAALSSMVCNLTIGKEKYIDSQDEIKKVLNKGERLRKKLTKLIDKDTEAFNDLMKAFKMPKENEEQKNIRSKAIQEGYRLAANVPFETAKTCEEILDITFIVTKKGNQSSITDAVMSAIMAKVGVEGAILNVKINLGSIKDEKFVKNINIQIEKLQKNASNKTAEILKIVNSKI